ncbi:hypothetical protein BG006_001345 [Podila minutissima]|uniref:Uncharacterized protein n=1 Tax=Podila minutissima TaxID=64525 RepID=A0A9P5SP56_9FUNG|nr:hypothetical protein BG006_001345 [Podila minutissima]
MDQDALFGFHFSASAAIDRFMALHRHGDRQQPSSTNATNSEARPSSRKGKATKLSVPTTIKDSSTYHPYKNKGKSDRKALPPDPVLSRTDNRVQEQARQEQHPQTYQSPPPNSSESHRYIASEHLLQNTGLVRALRDPACAHADLVERDFSYLRSILPPLTKNRDTTRVEADLVLDEHNAALFYSLRLLGQASLSSDTGSSSGLEELVYCIARIGPRYKVLWIVLEEYNWTPRTRATTPHLTNAFMDPTAKKRQVSPAFLASSLPRQSPAQRAIKINPYIGPVMDGLTKLLSWVTVCHNQNTWMSKLPTHTGEGDTYPSITLGRGQKRFQTQILFAADERAAARMVRSIGDRILGQIQEAVEQGVRGERDGWQSREEWLWREWLNEQESTHERFLCSLQVFNPFSAQLILSLCRLKEFLAMSHSERVRTVGQFVDGETLVTFQKMMNQPWNSSPYP